MKQAPAGPRSPAAPKRISVQPVAGRDYPKNFREFLIWFPDDEACRHYLERLRWGRGFTCPHCAVVDPGFWDMGDGYRRCKACRKECSVTSGTIFHRTRYSLQMWFHAIWFVVHQKHGVSALGLQREFGFRSYETAWAWLHKLRRCMEPTSGLLAGSVEVDETFVGGTVAGKFRGRSPLGKTIVAIAVENGSTYGAGRCRMAVIPNTSAASLEAFVSESISVGSKVVTDAWPGYNGVTSLGYTHEKINISASGDPAHVHLPNVHRIAALLKRWILGTHQGGMNPDQLAYYLDEFTFRFNRRKSHSRGLLFYRLLEQAASTGPKPLKDLWA